MIEPTVRLYARTKGGSSHAVVSRGFESVLSAAGLLAGVVGLDEAIDLDSTPAPGALAPSAVFTGPLGVVERTIQNARHLARYVMVAPNSNLIPPSLLAMLGKIATHLLAPSTWAAQVIAEQMATIGASKPIITVPHGVSHEFRCIPELRVRLHDSYQAGRFTVLHLSTSERQRKGTVELVQAWGQLRAERVLPPAAQLVLILDSAAALTLQDAFEKMPEGVLVVSRLDAPSEHMCRTLSRAHVVCQPSRGEGFGMCGVEALASGVPVVATDVTGHSQWFAPGLPGAVRVETGELAPIDDVPGAVAPSLDASAVATALTQAYDTWTTLADEAESNAEQIRQQWSWARQLAGLVDMLRS